MSTNGRIVVEVDDGAEAQARVTEWLRVWRRRGARRDGKVEHLHQGAVQRIAFHAPAAAIADLVERLHGAPGGGVVVNG